MDWKRNLLLWCYALVALAVSAQPREIRSLDKGWQFAFGDASLPERDFGCGTEYFNYLTKAASIHNEAHTLTFLTPKSGGKSGQR